MPTVSITKLLIPCATMPGISEPRHSRAMQNATASDASIGGRYEDCRKRGYATKVVESYFRRYAPAAFKRGEAETLARMHNGGPRGHLIRATRGYWQRVRKLLPS